MKTARITFALLLALTAAASAAASIRPTDAAYTATGQVKGSIWRDDDGDGQRQPGESGLAFRVQLRNIQTGEALAATSSASGEYNFAGLAPANYAVEVDVGPDSGYGTFPARQLVGRMQTGVAVNDSLVEGVNFGILPITRVPRFLGSVTIDGSRAATRPDVDAFVNGKNCGARVSLIPPEVGVSVYHVAVAPAELVAGCGVPGSTVTFTVNGRPANEAATWRPAGNPLAEGLNLTVGSPVASTTPSPSQPSSGATIRPPVVGDGGLR